MSMLVCPRVASPMPTTRLWLQSFACCYRCNRPGVCLKALGAKRIVIASVEEVSKLDPGSLQADSLQPTNQPFIMGL